LEERNARRSTRNTGAETVYLSLCRSGQLENFFITAEEVFFIFLWEGWNWKKVAQLAHSKNLVTHFDVVIFGKRIDMLVFD